jgi:hypothetical protein
MNSTTHRENPRRREGRPLRERLGVGYMAGIDPAIPHGFCPLCGEDSCPHPGSCDDARLDAAGMFGPAHEVETRIRIRFKRVQE